MKLPVFKLLALAATNIVRIGATCLAVFGLQFASAQTPANPPLPPDLPAPAQTNVQRHGEQMDAGYVDQWLGMLQKRSPEEFNRMTQLRKDNPEEFRRQMREKIHGFWARSGGLNERPAIGRLIKSLSDSDRDWLLRRLGEGANMGDGHGPGNGRDGRADWAELGKEERDIRTLADKIRASGDAAERTRMTGDLRTMVAAFQDKREQLRVEQLAAMEKKLQELRTQVEERKTGRDKLIEQWMKELLDKNGHRP